MKFLLALFIIPWLCYGTARAQSISYNDSVAKKNMIMQAKKMANAFVTADYKTLAEYTYPFVVKSMGGAVAMVTTITKMMSDMKKQGVSFRSASIGEPSDILKSGKELQGTIPEYIVMNVAKGRVEGVSTLVAISSDNGLHWTFIDTSNKDLASLRKSIPGLSPALVIPPATKAIHYNE